MNVQIEKLIKKCKLGNLKKEPSRVSGGLLNRMYKVQTDKETFAIKLLNSEVMKRENAKRNHTFAETVSNIAKDNNVSCLPAKIIDGEILQQVDGYYFLIFDWFEGNTIKKEELTIEKTKKVAKELLKIHKVDFGELREKCETYYDTNIVNWEFFIEKIDNEKIKKLLDNIQKFSELDKQSIKSLKTISKNMVISHRDIYLPNILWDNNENPVIIDWESSGLINPSMEVVETAWNLSEEQKYFDKEKFDAFVTTYKENGGILNEFDEALKADYKAKFGWLEYNLKRICGIECLDEEEKILGEEEVIKTINEINSFHLYSKYMKA